MEEFNWKDLFAFTKKERSGIITLAILILLSIAARVLLPQWTDQEVQISKHALQRMDSLQQNITTIQKEKAKQYSYEKSFKSKSFENKDKPLNPFPFDPNKLDKSGWKKMGFSSSDADMIMKYKNAGGTFRKKEDVKKLYCVDNQKYNKLKGYIRIDTSEFYNERITKKEYEKPSFDKVIDLNKADTVDLVEVPGIGPFYARQILKYRSALGGYVNKRQIKEVYGLEDKYQQFLSYFKVDTLITRPIKINTAEYYDILAHPYIDKRLAYQITEYRRTKGDFQSSEDLKKINQISDSLIRKIEPYISTD